MEINNNNSSVRQALVAKILNGSTSTTSETSEATKANDTTTNEGKTTSSDKVSIGLSQYINSELLSSNITAEREEKVAKLKELYEKGEYKTPEAKELAKSFVQDINDEIALARNKVFFGDDEI